MAGAIWVEFKDEDQDADGMPIGPAYIVTAADRIPVGFTAEQQAAWYRRDKLEEWAAANGYEVREA